MWGNRIGWGISGGIVIGFVGLILLIYMAGQASDPTSFTNEKTLAAITNPVNPTTVLPSMTDPTDSGQLYRDAIADYRRNSTAYDTIVSKVRYSPADLKLPGIKALLDARNSNKATIFASKPEDLINYDNEKENLEALMKVASAVKTIGLLRNADKQKDAAQYFEAVFSLGYKMFQERLRYEQLFKGDGLMGEGIEMLIQIADKAKDQTRVQALRDLKGARIDYFKSLMPINRVISSIDPNVVAQHPGDVMALAKESKERMWRVEAIMKLGRQRYYSERKGDQLAAIRTVKYMADTETDPIIKLAATQARDLTIEKYRMLQ